MVSVLDPQVFQKNLSALKEYHRELFLRLEGKELSQSVQDQISKKYYSNCKSSDLINDESLKNEGQAYWKKHPVKNSALAIFYGMGNLSHLKLYWQKPLHHCSILIEKSLDNFLWHLHTSDLSSLLSQKKMKFFVALDEKDLFKETYSTFRGTDFMAGESNKENFFSYLDLKEKESGDYYLSSAKILERAIEAVKSATHFDGEDIFRGLINVVNNLPYLDGAYDLNELKNLAQNKTGIIVSTGPSLDKSIAALKEFQNKGIIYSADSAALILIKNGIQPDFVGSLERLKMTSEFLAQIPETNDLRLICPPYIYPDTLANWQGEKYIYPLNGLPSQWLLGETEFHDCGLSVANMGLRFFNLLGVKKVYFFGQDLSFAPNSNQNHASGSHHVIHDLLIEEKEQQNLEENNPNWVLGNSGKKIFTRDHFRIMASQVEEEIAIFEMQAYNVIPKDYGMKIGNALQIEPGDLDIEGSEDCEIQIESASFNKWQREFLENNFEMSLKKIQEYKAVFLERIDSMAKFMHENFYLFIDEGMTQGYLKLFSEIQNDFSQKWIPEPVFKTLLTPLIAHAYTETLKKQNEINQNKEMLAKDQIYLHHQNWKECFDVFYYWASRIEFLMCQFLQENQKSA